VPQPSYTPTTPSTPSTTTSTPGTTPSTSSNPSTQVTSPSNEKPARTTARSERGASKRYGAKTRTVHYHRARSALVTYSCTYLGCVRTYAWAFPCQYYSRYCYVYDRPYGWYRG
jgi:hypothetical protein